MKLDLDSLRAANAGNGLAQLGGHVSGHVSGQGASSALAPDKLAPDKLAPDKLARNTLAPDKPSAAADVGGRQSELSNVMQVLGGGGHGRKLTTVSNAPGAKGHRRARIEVLKDKVLPCRPAP